MNSGTLMTQTDDRWIARFLPEHYSLGIGAKTFIVRFAPILFFEGYNEMQLHALVGSSVWEISFSEESVTPDGRLVADYGLTGKGDSFKVLGSVAHGILAWAEAKRPDYLFWWSLEPKRQRVYNLMLRYFSKRGSPWERLERDPFTKQSCRQEAFWVVRR